MSGIQILYLVLSKVCLALSAFFSAAETAFVSLQRSDFETVAGLILNLLGNIPRQREQLKYKDMKIVITRMRGMKIEEIMLTKGRHATPTN